MRLGSCYDGSVSINQGFDKDSNVGDLLLLDHDGTVLFRKRVDDFIHDTHFDDIAMADFMGNGTSQILLEKGILLDLKGNVIWDLSNQMDHGQWIAHTPDPKGKGELAFISELWGSRMKSMLFTGQGQKIKDISGFPWPDFSMYKGMMPLPSRCHMVRWDAASEPEIFFTQQAYVQGEYNCTKTVRFPLTGLFTDLQGNLLGELPFEDAQIQGYHYNGEVHSKVADVDGDGQQEIIFPRQDGHVMIIKKRNG